MFSASPDLAQNKTLQIMQEDKFFSRLLSKENSVANPSFRVYYGGVSGAVPFMWESQPGTPKHTFSDTSLPPLTPPPSYYSKSNSKPIKKHSRSGLLHALFPKMISLKKTNPVPSSPSSSSSSYWSSSPIFLAMSPGKYNSRSRFSTPRSSFDSRADYEEAAAIGSPTSTLCFAIGRGSISKLRGCYGW
ncbi:YLP motif-containing protein 1-like [Durio zibethinus]|uniref:YLP motif-containing protein 1-like n=1 Tax=Durio zibethinus TaxID=66656 RepID=A0A6P5Y4C9_DURZI|nr:YLP motif-containing protein 1-like [Durio zibethinus]